MARNEIKERRYRDIKAHARAAKEKNRYKAERIAKHFGVSVSTVRTIVRSASFKKYRADIEARNAARRQARETVAEVAPKPVQQELLTPTPEESPARTESSYAPERDFETALEKIQSLPTKEDFERLARTVSDFSKRTNANVGMLHERLDAQYALLGEMYIRIKRRIRWPWSR